MSAPAESVADALARIEKLAAVIGVSRIGLIALAGAPSAADKIASAFVEGLVTVSEARAMIAEARLTAPARLAGDERVLPRRIGNG